MNLSRYSCIPTLVLVLALSTAAPGQNGEDERVIAGRNVNMVSGMEFPGGDPFLQRQNESTGGVSVRNPMHLLFGANDYRTVDLPGRLDDKMPGDAWLGLFKSFDGGQSWESTLLPGFPQDETPEGLAVKQELFDLIGQFGLEAAADPLVRAGTNGLFYYSGISFNRGDFSPSVALVARFIDLNNDEDRLNNTSIRYIDTKFLDFDPGGVLGEGFIDKTWMAVDIPREGAELCEITLEDGSTLPPFPGGNVYLAYAQFLDEEDFGSRILFSRSTDCGDTWSEPTELSNPGGGYQGATIAIDPTTGDVSVAWREFSGVVADVSGLGGCTLSQVYWKTHPEAL